MDAIGIRNFEKYKTSQLPSAIIPTLGNAPIAILPQSRESLGHNED
jgi:hypothetical protein